MSNKKNKKNIGEVMSLGEGFRGEYFIFDSTKTQKILYAT